MLLFFNYFPAEELEVPAMARVRARERQRGIWGRNRARDRGM